MKIIHRKTLWIHSVFSLFVIGLLAALIVFNRNVPIVLLAIAVGVYVIGNAAIHIKRDDFREDTMLEYFLLGAAVLIVLVSAVGA